MPHNQNYVAVKMESKQFIWKIRRNLTKNSMAKQTNVEN